MPFYTGDYLRDTRHLSCSEHGCYILAITYCWDSQGPMPLDERKQFAIVGARSGDEMEAWRRVRDEFFVPREDGHYNVRVQLEIQRASLIVDHARERGIKSAEARRQKYGTAQPQPRKALESVSKGSGKASESLPNPPSPSPSPSPKKEKTPPTPPSGGESSPGFARFWEAWPAGPRKVAKAQCIAKWKSRNLEQQADAIVAALEASKTSRQWTRDNGEYIPAPLVWLNQARWEAVPAMADRGYI